MYYAGSFYALFRFRSRKDRDRFVSDAPKTTYNFKIKKLTAEDVKFNQMLGSYNSVYWNADGYKRGVYDVGHRDSYRDYDYGVPKESNRSKSGTGTSKKKKAQARSSKGSGSNGH